MEIETVIYYALWAGFVFGCLVGVVIGRILGSRL